jgi:hypothetical protein
MAHLGAAGTVGYNSCVLLWVLAGGGELGDSVQAEQPCINLVWQHVAVVVPAEPLSRM